MMLMAGSLYLFPDYSADLRQVLGCSVEQVTDHPTSDKAHAEREREREKKGENKG